MKWARHGVLTGTVGLVVLLAGAATADAQIRPEVGLRASFLPLYAGDATVGAIRAWGATVHLGAALDQGGTRAVEAFYTISPRDAGPHGSAPRIQLVGAVVQLSDGFDRSVGLVGTVGLGMIDVSATARPPCDPPACFAEGGPFFPDARLATGIAGLGVDAALSGPWRLRFDARGHLPFGGDETMGDSRKLRLDFGAGLRIAF